jgi:acyl-ACP thioesterase
MNFILLPSNQKAMFNPDTRFTKEFTISSFDVDASKKASLQSLCRYMQEMAVLHAEKLKLGFHDMMKEQRAWVLAQMLIHIDRLPSFHEKIYVSTWSNGPDGRFAMRDFYIHDAKKNIIARASSTWFVIDIAEKGICRLESYFEGYNYNNIEYALGRKPERIKAFDDAEQMAEIIVKYSDLDINGHVNNIRYIDYIFNQFSYAFRMEHDIREIEMNFLKESKMDHTLRCMMKSGKEKNEFLHCLMNLDAGKASFTARSCWN